MAAVGGRLIPITQTRVGRKGNCLSACLASILEIPLQLVPDFAADTDSDEEFLLAVDAWLAKKGLRYRQVAVGETAPVGYHTTEGLSPRGGQHAVVAKDGAPVWDPHPPDGTGRGLVRPERYGVLEATARDQKPGEVIRLPNGRRATIAKVTPARDLFGEPELHVKTTTGEVLPIPVKEK